MPTRVLAGGADAGYDAAVVAQPPTPTPEPRQRILVVDDSRDSAESMALLLALEGHETFTAHDGPEAVARAAELAPDILLLDIGLPGLSGYEVCRQVRAQPAGEAMVIVALSGWGQAADKTKARDAGFDDHLTKPVEHEALTRTLAAIIARRP